MFKVYTLELIKKKIIKNISFIQNKLLSLPLIVIEINYLRLRHLLQSNFLLWFMKNLVKLFFVFTALLLGFSVSFGVMPAGDDLSGKILNFLTVKQNEDEGNEQLEQAFSSTGLSKDESADAILSTKARASAPVIPYAAVKDFNLNVYFLDDVGGHLPTGQLIAGNKVRLVVEIENMTDKDMRSPSLTVKFPDHPGVVIPKTTDWNLEELTVGGVKYTPSYNTVDKTFNINVPKELVHSKSTKRTIFVPVQLSASCSDFANAFSNFVVVSASFSDNEGLPYTVVNYAEGEVASPSCFQLEYMCEGSSLEYFPQGTGFEGFDWTHEEGDPKGSVILTNPNEEINTKKITLSRLGFYSVAKHAYRKATQKEIDSEKEREMGNLVQRDGVWYVRRTNTDYISVISTVDAGDLYVSPLILQSDVYTHCSEIGGNVVAHFYLCPSDEVASGEVPGSVVGTNTNQRTITIPFRSAKRIIWQQYKEAAIKEREAAKGDRNCTKKDDRYWTDLVGTENSHSQKFDRARAGEYRIKIEPNGSCSEPLYLYFNVYASELNGNVTPYDQTDSVLASISVEMFSKNASYTYVLKDATGKELAREVKLYLGQEEDSPDHPNKHTFANIALPDVESKFTVEVFSTAFDGCSFTRKVTLRDKTVVKGTPTDAIWEDCNHLAVKFDIKGGVEPYKVAIYSVDDISEYGNQSLAAIPDDKFTLIEDKGESVSIKAERQNAKYKFIIRDSQGNNVVTGYKDVGTNTDFMLNVVPTHAKCPGEKGSITISLGRKLSDGGSMGMGVENVKLYRYDIYNRETLVDKKAEGIQVGGSGMTNIPPGKYAVKLKAFGQDCEFSNVFLVEQETELITADVGVVEDITCSTKDPKMFKIAVNNVEGGVKKGKHNYQFKFPGGDWQNSNMGEVNNSGSVWVRDAASNCEGVEIPFVVESAPIKPTVNNSDIQLVYNCDGSGIVLVKPITPPGKNYLYEYEYSETLDPNDPNNTGVRRKGYKLKYERNDKGQLEVVKEYIGPEISKFLITEGSGVFALPVKPNGDTSPYYIKVFYKDAEIERKIRNVLYTDDFGIGADTDCEEAKNYTTFDPTKKMLSVGFHKVTSEIDTTGIHRTPTNLPTLSEEDDPETTGRFLAVSPTSSKLVLYEFEVNGLQENKNIKVDFDVTNLMNMNYSEISSSVEIELEVEGIIYTKTTGTIQLYGLDDSVPEWTHVSAEFNKIQSFLGGKNSGKIRIKAKEGNCALGLDNIVVSQDPTVCQEPVVASVIVQPGNGFRAVQKSVSNSGCSTDNSGKVIYIIEKYGGSEVGKDLGIVEYSVDKKWADPHGVPYKANIIGRNRDGKFEIEVKVPEGTHQINIRQEGCNPVDMGTVTIEKGNPVKVTQGVVQGNNQGCGAEYRAASEYIISGGVPPYSDFKYRKVVNGTPGEWVTTSTPGNGIEFNPGVQASKVVIRALEVGEYEFHVSDGNNCDPNSVSGKAKIEPPYRVDFSVESSTCYSGDKMDGEIKFTMIPDPREAEDSKKPNFRKRRYKADLVYLDAVDPNTGEPEVRNMGYLDEGTNEMKITGLSKSRYTLKVYDASTNCMAEKNIVIPHELELELPNSPIILSCDAAKPTIIKIRSKGGIGKKTVQWYQMGLSQTYKGVENTDGGNFVIRVLEEGYTTSGGVTVPMEAEVTVKKEGTFNIRVTDRNGCHVDQVFEVRSNKPRWADGIELYSDPIVCDNIPTGTIRARKRGEQIGAVLSVTEHIWGGLKPMIVVKKLDDSGNELPGDYGTAGLKSGAYRVYVKDTYGCVTDPKELIIKEKDRPIITGMDPNPGPDSRNVGGVTPVLCSATGGETYGSITVEVSKGMPPYILSILDKNGNRVINHDTNRYIQDVNVPNGRHTFAGLGAGEYTIVAKDQSTRNNTYTGADSCISFAKFVVPGNPTSMEIEWLPYDGKYCTGVNFNLYIYSDEPNVRLNLNDIYVSVYKGGDPADLNRYPASSWVQGNSIVDFKTKKGLRKAIKFGVRDGDVIPGTSNSFVIRNGNCYTVFDGTVPGKGPFKAPGESVKYEIRDVRIENACGDGGRGDYKFKVVGDFQGVDYIITEFFRYPYGIQVSHDDGRPYGRFIRTDPGKTEYEFEFDDLPEGEFYYIVYTFTGKIEITPGQSPFKPNDQGIMDWGCVMTSDPFKIAKASNPVTVESAKIVTAQHCQVPASVEVKVSGGMPMYQYFFKRDDDSDPTTPPAPPTDEDWKNTTKTASSSFVYDGKIQEQYLATPKDWFVFVKDGYGCISYKYFEVEEDPHPEIESAYQYNKVGEACTFNGTHKLIVTMSNPGKISEGRKHSFVIGRYASNYEFTQAPTPVDFVKVNGDYPRDANGNNIYQLIIPNIWTDSEEQLLEIYDANGCGAATQFRILPNFDFRLQLSKMITCVPGDEAAEVTIKDIKNFDFQTQGIQLQNGALNRYTFEVFKVKPNGDAEDSAITQGHFVDDKPVKFKIDKPGVYRVRVLDHTRPDCPVNTNKPGVTRDIVIQDRQIPLFEMPITYQENCYGTEKVGEGTGFVRISTGHLSLAPFSYRIEKALDVAKTEELRRKSGNPQAEVTIPVPVVYQTEYRVGDKVEGVVEVSGTKGETDIEKIKKEGQSTVVTYSGLMGLPTGVEYHVVAKSGETGCDQTIKVLIKSPNKIRIADDSILVSPFGCDGSNTMQSARISVNPAVVSGGTGVYSYRFYSKDTQTGEYQNIQESNAPYLIISDKNGGTFALEVVDSNGCVSDRSEDFKINGYVTAESIVASVVNPITCETNSSGEKVGETVKLTLVTDPVESRNTKFSYVIRGVNNSYTKEVRNTLSKELQFDALQVGSYAITVINEDTGCSSYTTYDIKSPDSFVIKAERDKTKKNSGRVTCNGGDDGEIVLTFVDTDLSNGDQSGDGFTYSVKYFENNSPVPDAQITKQVLKPNKYVIKGLKAGRYRVSAKSTSTQCVTPNESVFNIVQAPAPMKASATQEYGATCSNDRGEILVDITGGILPYKVKIKGMDQATGNPVKLDPNYTPEDPSDDVEEYEVDVYSKYLFSDLPGGSAEGVNVQYTLEITDGWGCKEVTGISPVMIERPYEITTTPVAKPTTCEGAEDGSIEFTNVNGGSGPGTYFYQVRNMNSGRVYPIQTGPVFKGLNRGRYQVVVIDKWNCMFTGEVDVEDPSPIQMTVTKEPEVICYDDVNGSSITIDVVGGTPTVAGLPANQQGYTVRLLNSERRIVKQKQVTSSTATIDGLFPGIDYEIQITDPQGCHLKIPYRFRIPSIPDLTTEVSFLNVCQDGEYSGRLEVKFPEMVDATKLKYSINSTDIAKAVDFDEFSLNSVYITNRDILKSAPNLQYLTLFYQDNGKTCSKKTPMFLVPNVTELDIARDEKVQLEPNDIKVYGKFGVPPYTYSFNGLDQGEKNIYKVKITDPDYVDPDTGKKMKKVEATVTDSLGCEKTMTIYYDYLDVEIPIFFTPTGDGINDGWAPKNTSLYLNMVVSIFDRHGRLITTLKQGEKWDGKYEGKPLPSGDYWYVLDLGEEENNRVFKGHFTLFR